jgi:L-alanine-DL-glutamate epimerase-like enolase superfamily enzyme
MGGEIAVAGIAHLSASTPATAFLAASHITATHVLLDRQPWLSDGSHVPIRNGKASIPQAGGLGLQIDAHRLPSPILDLGEAS